MTSKLDGDVDSSKTIGGENTVQAPACAAEIKAWQSDSENIPPLIFRELQIQLGRCTVYGDYAYLWYIDATRLTDAAKGSRCRTWCLMIKLNHFLAARYLIALDTMTECWTDTVRILDSISHRSDMATCR